MILDTLNNRVTDSPPKMVATLAEKGREELF